jgi:DNA-binding CsgD family transcriptional regulator
MHAGLTWLDMLPAPMLVTTVDRRLLTQNGAARQLLAEGWVVQRDGHVMSVGQLGARQLMPLLQNAARQNASKTPLWMPSTLTTGWLQVAPFLPCAPMADNGLLLIVHLDQPGLAQTARIDALSHQCRLSRTERQVLLLLSDGDSVEAAANLLGVRICTVRSHVRSLLGKTQAPNLMQLLRWTGSAAALPH